MESPLLRPIAAALSLILAAPPLHAQDQPVGFERTRTSTGVEVGIWYPSDGTPKRQRLGLYQQDVVEGGRVEHGRHPLVVISHGTGGDFAGHVDTAEALAKAGFVVAALTHPGDNWRDNSRATKIEERPAALSSLISFMLDRWPGRASVDPARVGAFGFSAGGFTVLAAAGGRPDMSRLGGHCADHPTFFVCSLLRAQPRSAGNVPWPALQDGRIKTVVVAAPALGVTFNRAGLADVRVPVQLWRAASDTILPAPFYADAVRDALPSRPEFHDIAGAGHFDFLSPCVEPASMPQLCESAAGFDRRKFHDRFNQAVVRFFSRYLAKRKQLASEDRTQASGR